MILYPCRDPHSEPAFLEEMVAEGSRYVFEEEAQGRLQAKYPFVYASPDDLTLVSGLGRGEWQQSMYCTCDVRAQGIVV